MAWGLGTAFKKYAKGRGKDIAKKTTWGNAWNLAKGQAANVALTGVMYGGLGALESSQSDNAVATGGKWAAAAGIDIASDIGMTGLALAAGALTGGVGFFAVQAFDMVTDLMGYDLSTAFINAVDSMDEEYNRLSGMSGRGYQMSRGGAQALQRQIANLQGAGSNVAEMMHN